MWSDSHLFVCNCYFSGRSGASRSFGQQRRKRIPRSSRTWRNTRTTWHQRGNWKCRNPRYGRFGFVLEGWGGVDTLLEDNFSINYTGCLWSGTFIFKCCKPKWLFCSQCSQTSLRHLEIVCSCPKLKWYQSSQTESGPSANAFSPFPHSFF